MKRVGIYSGTFDPVHEGHLAFAREALQQCGLDKIFFLVEPRPRRKQGIKAFEHRVRMVSLAIELEPKFGSIILEQQRFTPVETLPVLQARFKGAELVMLMGDDMLSHFADWPQVESLVSQISFAIGARTKTQAAIRQRLSVIEQTKGLRVRCDLFDAPRAGVSSTQVRSRLRKGEISDEVPKIVLDYIAAEGLYASSKLGS